MLCCPEICAQSRTWGTRTSTRTGPGLGTTVFSKLDSAVSSRGFVTAQSTLSSLHVYASKAARLLQINGDENFGTTLDMITDDENMDEAATARGARRYRTSRSGRFRTTVTVTVSVPTHTNQLDGRWTGRSMPVYARRKYVRHVR
jgi:hypothetical protein